MKAIIVNSGVGSRIKEKTYNIPKCLIEIEKDVTILDRQLTALDIDEISEIIITTGYLEDKIKAHIEAKHSHIKHKIKFVYNKEYESTNYIKSLDLIEDFDDSIVLMHGDLVMDSVIIKNIINDNKNYAVVDSQEENLKDFKATLNNGKITYIAVDNNDENIIALQPIYKINEASWKIWRDEIKNFCENGNVKVYAENALNTKLSEIELLPYDIKGLLCCEIDTVEDFEKITRRLCNG